MFDTNVILDLILHREPFYADSRRAIDLVTDEKIEGAIPATSAKDIFYVVERAIGETEARNALDKLSYVFSFSSVEESDVIDALSHEMDDFEDGLIAVSAKRLGFDMIITRNTKDFLESEVPAIHPKDIKRALDGHFESGVFNLDSPP